VRIVVHIIIVIFISLACLKFLKVKKNVVYFHHISKHNAQSEFGAVFYAWKSDD